MAEPNVKIINLEKTVNGVLNKITVTDTDGDFGTNIIGTGLSMGFDANDKVTVTGDISVFSQEEINNAFFKNYNSTDVRTDEELAELTPTALENKDGKITGDTSKAFALQDLAKVGKIEQSGATPQQSNTTNQYNPAMNWQAMGMNLSQQNFSTPFANPNMGFGLAGLVAMVSRFFGSFMNANFCPPYAMENLAVNLWNSIPDGTTPFNPPQNTVNTPVEEAQSATVTESQDPVVTDETPTEATPQAVITEGAPTVAETVKTEPKSAIEGTEYKDGEVVGKNKAGNTIKKYTNQEGNRVCEIYKDGELIKVNTYLKNGDEVSDFYQDGKVVEKHTVTYEKIGDIKYDGKVKKEYFEGYKSKFQEEQIKKLQESQVAVSDNTRIVRPQILDFAK